MNGTLAFSKEETKFICNMNLYQRWKREKYYTLSRLPCQEGKFKKEFPGFGVYKSTQ